MIKRLLLTFVFAGVYTGVILAQYGVQLSYFAPTKDLAYLVKPTLGFEINCKGGDIDKRFKFGGSIGFASFKPTQDTFRIYAMQYGGNGTYLLPGKQVVHKYRIVPIAFTDEFKILKDKKLSPFIGIDAVFNLLMYSDYTKIEGLSETTVDNDSFWVLSVLPKIGVTYELKEKWLLNFTIAKYVSLIGTAKELSFWKPGIGVSFYPN